VRRVLIAGLLAVAVVSTAACGSNGNSSGSAGPQTVTLLTHDSFAVSKSVLAAFTAKTGIRVKIDKSAGDAGSALSQAILTTLDHRSSNSRRSLHPVSGPHRIRWKCVGERLR